MFTNSRLSSLLKTVPSLSFDAQSKFVIMSDCHRGTGTWSDNFMKNQHLYFAALTHYNHNRYTYIELGDGDELWENRDMKQIIQTHSHVFWLLSKFYEDNRLYLIYGNHDCAKKNGEFMTKHCQRFYCESSGCHIPLFPALRIHEGLLLNYLPSGRSFFLVHGHQGDLLNDILWKLARFLVRYAWNPLELLGFRDPTSAAQNYDKKDTTELRLSQWAATHNQPLIAGHTHRPVLLEKDLFYVNCGSCVHPRCITALEIVDGTISLVKWYEKTDEQLALYVGKDILSGPITL